ncbi:hypothetical protein OPV22_005688 [Ensete ventricosum]|nr:hypothetical protein OPV22_005688 [Ensete ventricosum]
MNGSCQVVEVDDDEYAKLIRRMNPPRVVIDNDACDGATVISVDSVNKHGILLEVVQVLTDLNLVITKAYISSDGSWFMDVFNVNDKDGNKIWDEEIRHPYIVQLFEVMATKTKIYFVMEYVRGGELFSRVAKGRLREDTARRYFQQLISAVAFCHARGVFHRDLKPENLLVDENGDLKVSDFGLSAVAEQSRGGDGLLHTLCGTPAYVARKCCRGGATTAPRSTFGPAASSSSC